jgi:beta-lactamase superfamily II metal-dependent hydrolase
VEVIIFDVEHGGCAAIISPSGQMLMIDCDNNDTTGWRPSAWVSAHNLRVANLTITNFDEDHVGDLPRLRPYVDTFSANWSVPTGWVRQTKAEDGIGPGIEAALNMVDGAVAVPAIDWGAGFTLRRFYHNYPIFEDENSLSVVTFIRYAGVSIVFPGDLTAPAWRLFMNNLDFVANLHATRIFVASHHGREDGYCPEIFDGWKPDAVIVSDKRVMYETQIVNYSQHANGVMWDDGAKRYMLTTRRSGNMRITPTQGGGYQIQVGV